MSECDADTHTRAHTFITACRHHLNSTGEEQQLWPRFQSQQTDQQHHKDGRRHPEVDGSAGVANWFASSWVSWESTTMILQGDESSCGWSESAAAIKAEPQAAASSEPSEQTAKTTAFWKSRVHKSHFAEDIWHQVWQHKPGHECWALGLSGWGVMGDSGTGGAAGWRPQPVTPSAALFPLLNLNALFMLHPWGKQRSQEMTNDQKKLWPQQPELHLTAASPPGFRTEDLWGGAAASSLGKKAFNNLSQKPQLSDCGFWTPAWPL